MSGRHTDRADFLRHQAGRRRGLRLGDAPRDDLVGVALADGQTDFQPAAPAEGVPGRQGGSHDPGHLVLDLGQRRRGERGAGEGSVEVLQPLLADLKQVRVDDAGRAVGGVPVGRQTLEQVLGRRGLDGPRRQAVGRRPLADKRRRLLLRRGRRSRRHPGDGNRSGPRAGRDRREETGHRRGKQAGDRVRDDARQGGQGRIDGTEQLRRAAGQARDGEIGIGQEGGRVEPSEEGGEPGGGGRLQPRASGGEARQRVLMRGARRRPGGNRRRCRPGNEEQGGGRCYDEALHVTLQRRAALILFTPAGPGNYTHRFREEFGRTSPIHINNTSALLPQLQLENRSLTVGQRFELLHGHQHRPRFRSFRWAYDAAPL